MFSANTTQVAATAANYIEDVFSTWLYNGTGSAQSIANGIDLAGKGGMVWLKSRSTNYNNLVTDTAQGIGSFTSLVTNDTSYGNTTALSAFNSTGFTTSTINGATANGQTFASWTFRKQPKFFDVVTYTGTGSVQNIAHNLGSTPGCMIIKCTSSASDWIVYHIGLPDASTYLRLNLTNGSAINSNVFNATAPTSTQFTVGTDTRANTSGATYVAYLFAHNAGGFGLTGTDNVISCGSGSWSGGSDNVVNVGYEVQWLMYKSTDIAGSNWMMYDTMRGMSYSASEFLRANLSDAAGTYNSPYAIYPTATGFTVPAGLVSTGNYIYIAIRRGPMKVPTDATKVFYPAASPSNGSKITTGFPVDLSIWSLRTGYSLNAVVQDRLRGVTTTSGSVLTPTLSTSLTDAEGNNQGTNGWDNTGIVANTGGAAWWEFQRAPGFFDEVCFTTPASISSPITQNHNLGVAPELVITKRRTGSSQWFTVCSYGMTASQYVTLETFDQRVAYGGGGTTTWSATSTTVTLPTGYFYTSSDYVYYLFASCPGVSKVGTYAGTGATQTIDCGFAGGARFVLIKRTDATGNWVVWDTARGMVAGTDPYLQLNTTNAEVNANWVYTTTGGFQIVTNNVNVNTVGSSYIYLAIA